MPDSMTQVVESDLTEAVLTASRALVGVAARSLAGVADEVSLPQYRALVVLAMRGPQVVNELADALGVHSSTTTRMCDRLVAKGLAQRSLSSENRRETVVQLSASGRELVDVVTAQRRAELTRIIGRIPEPLRGPTVEALRAFSDAAGEPPDHAWHLGWT